MYRSLALDYTPKRANVFTGPVPPDLVAKGPPGISRAGIPRSRESGVAIFP